MTRIFTVFLLLVVCVSFGYSQNGKTKVATTPLSAVYDGRVNEVVKPPFIPQNYQTLVNPNAPVGTVPFPLNYNDYLTNGNNQRRLIVLGDTVIVGADINPDMTGPPPVATVGRMYYQVSYDAGATWLSDAVNVNSGTSTRWPNLSPIITGADRSIAITGRIYTSPNKGIAMVDALLGSGIITQTLLENVGRDLFMVLKNSTKLGGLISSTGASTATDSLLYYDFDYTNNTFSPKKVIEGDMQANYRYYIAISSDGQNITAAYWRSTEPSLTNVPSMRLFTSSDGGSTFSGQTVYPYGQIMNGDSTSAWFGADVVYKPNSNIRGIALNTLGPGNFAYPERTKLVYWNGTGLSVICDWLNYSYLRDTSVNGLFNQTYAGIQVGMTFFSHPSLAYSSDGSVLYCAFSVVTPDTLAAFNYNDIAITWSTNDGATWQQPRLVANKPMRDEIYPTLSRTGNTSDVFNIVYAETGIPGAYTFTNNTAPDTVYTIYKRINKNSLPLLPVSVQSISSEVPASYTLSQNYPNPFNPSTTIKFDVKQSGIVSLKIYDITGKEVSNLVNEKLSVGTYKYNFNGANLSSGIYFYKLTVNGFSDVKKMMLIK